MIQFRFSSGGARHPSLIFFDLLFLAYLLISLIFIKAMEAMLCESNSNRFMMKTSCRQECSLEIWRDLREGKNSEPVLASYGFGELPIGQSLPDLEALGNDFVSGQ